MIADAIFAVVAVSLFLTVGAVVSFLFFGFLAYKEDFQDMPHEETRK